MRFVRIIPHRPIDGLTREREREVVAVEREASLIALCVTGLRGRYAFYDLDMRNICETMFTPIQIYRISLLNHRLICINCVHSLYLFIWMLEVLSTCIGTCHIYINDFERTSLSSPLLKISIRHKLKISCNQHIYDVSGISNKQIVIILVFNIISFMTDTMEYDLIENDCFRSDTDTSGAIFKDRRIAPDLKGPLRSVSLRITYSKLTRT